MELFVTFICNQLHVLYRLGLQLPQVRQLRFQSKHCVVSSSCEVCSLLLHECTERLDLLIGKQHALVPFLLYLHKPGTRLVLDLFKSSEICLELGECNAVCFLLVAET